MTSNSTSFKANQLFVSDFEKNKTHIPYKTNNTLEYGNENNIVSLLTINTNSNLELFDTNYSIHNTHSNFNYGSMYY